MTMSINHDERLMFRMCWLCLCREINGKCAHYQMKIFDAIAQIAVWVHAWVQNGNKNKTLWLLSTWRCCNSKKFPNHRLSFFAIIFFFAHFSLICSCLFVIIFHSATEIVFLLIIWFILHYFQIASRRHHWTHNKSTDDTKSPFVSKQSAKNGEIRNTCFSVAQKRVVRPTEASKEIIFCDINKKIINWKRVSAAPNREKQLTCASVCLWV